MDERLEVADAAYLLRQEAGEIVLCIGSVAYEPDDAIPAAVRARQKLPGGESAGYFVTQIMMRRYGEDDAAWPDLAQRFIAGGPR
jgi:hypothetical protein